MESRADGIDRALADADAGQTAVRCYLSPHTNMNEVYGAIVSDVRCQPLVRALLGTDGLQAPGPDEDPIDLDSQEHRLIVSRYLTDRTAAVADEVLAQGEATAWVGLTDRVALGLMEHLHRVGRRLPQDLSLVGIDDTIEAFRAGLTSYGYNVSAAVHSLIAHIFAPRRLRRHSRQWVATIQGTVMARSTTGLGPDAGRLPGREDPSVGPAGTITRPVQDRTRP